MTGDRPSQVALVAGSDALTRTVVGTVLEVEGLDVVEASSGEAALALLLERPVALVVLEEVLPDVRGRDVLARARAAGVDAPALLLTAVDLDDLGFDPLGAGFDAALARPFSPLHLLEVVEDLLAVAADAAGTGSTR